jgi:hypothetical protein
LGVTIGNPIAARTHYKRGSEGENRVLGDRALKENPFAVDGAYGRIEGEGMLRRRR